MSEEDRLRWDARHAAAGRAPVVQPAPPPVFAPFVDLFPREGFALDIACGRGQGALWLAARGMEVYGVDVSRTAVALARELVSDGGLSDRCRFEVFDLDTGLPPCPPVDLLLCHKFRDARLDRAMIDRLAPRGLLAVAALSEVDAAPGPFRAKRGELREAFRELELLIEGEGDGLAWIIGRRGSAHRRSR